MVAFEVVRRFGDTASMTYVDLLKNPEGIEPELLAQIEREGRFWPVSAINGRIFADGMVTLPRVLTAIDDEKSRDARVAEAE